MESTALVAVVRFFSSPFIRRREKHKSLPAWRGCFPDLTRFFFFLTLGAGNIGDKGVPATERKDRDIIPEAAVRLSTDTGDYHTGRGGAGNEHTAAGHAHHGDHGHKSKETAAAEAGAPEAEKETTGAPPLSVADKLKQKLFSAFK